MSFKGYLSKVVQSIKGLKIHFPTLATRECEPEEKEKQEYIECTEVAKVDIFIANTIHRTATKMHFFGEMSLTIFEKYCTRRSFLDFTVIQTPT